MKELGIDASVQEVKDITKILDYPILTTPGLVINEEVVCSGRRSRGLYASLLKEGADEKHKDCCNSIHMYLSGGRGRLRGRRKRRTDTHANSHGNVTNSGNVMRGS